MERKELVELLQEHNQEHLLWYYDRLTNEKQANLAAQLEKLDWRLLKLSERGNVSQERGEIKPLAGLNREQIEANREAFEKAGLQAIKQSKAGAVLLAGGQGTRLGCSGPKGNYNIGVTREVYIYELLFDSILQVVYKTATWIPLYIMTSDKTHEETTKFLKEHQYFGYNEAYIRFFVQDMNPSIDYEGKLLMEAPDRLSLSPSGNGGWFSSMVKAGLLKDLEARGIEWLNIFAVDNVLQKIADPLFLGATISSGKASGAKVVRKAEPGEHIGVLCAEDGKPSIVEYYEMTEAMLQERTPTGELSYSLGVTLNYLFRLDKLKEILSKDLPIHVAEKKIPYLNQEGEYIQPDEPNGYKFEELALDMIPLFEECLPFEVIREEEFAPVKNASGVDSPETARELLKKNHIEL